MEFHHIGIACKDIGKEIERIKQIHTVKQISDVIYDEYQNAYLCMVEVENGLNIELISGDQVNNLLKRNISYYHICYSVSNIQYHIDDLTSKGAILISPPKPAKLFNGNLVAFFHFSYGLVELVEIAEN